MEGNTIRTIMTGLENFDFSLREYVRDGGVSVAKRAAEHSGIAYSLAEDVDTGLHFILRSRFLAKVEAETERVTFTSMGRKYILTYATEDGLLDGLAIITPKKVCVRLGKGCQSVQKTARLLMELRDTGSLRWNLPEDALRFDDLSEPEVRDQELRKGNDIQ